MQNSKKIYLSVDLDFWRTSPNLAAKFFKSLFESGLPICVAVDHHDILDHVNGFKECDTLINIDYHSDICDEGVAKNEELECGNWVNYVDWHKKCTYRWIYPIKECAANYRLGNTALYSGWCHTENEDPRENSGWKNLVTTEKLIPANLLNEVAAIGICFSPDYFYKDDEYYEEIFRKQSAMLLNLCNKYRVKIIPSQKEENNRVLTPFPSPAPTGET